MLYYTIITVFYCKNTFPMLSDFNQRPKQQNKVKFIRNKSIGFDILVYFFMTQSGSSLLRQEFDCFEDGKGVNV